MPYLSPDDLAAALPRYRCHKIVQAARIIDVLSRPLRLRLDVALIGTADGNVNALLEGSQDAWFLPRPDIGGGMALPGAYLVRYDDGYLSISPEKPFVEGYTLIDPAIEHQLSDVTTRPSRCGVSFMHEGERGEGRLETCALHTGHGGDHMTAFDAGLVPAVAASPQPTAAFESQMCGHPVGTRACNRTLGHEGPHEVGEDFLSRPKGD